MMKVDMEEELRFLFGFCLDLCLIVECEIVIKI